MSQLYVELQPIVRGHLRRARLPTTGDVDDLFHQILIRVYRGLSTYDPARGAFLAWLNAIVRNEVRSHRRWLELSGGPPRALPLGDESEAPHDEPAFTALLERDELRSWLGELGPREAQTIVLRYVLDMSLRDCASALNTTENAVSQAQGRALAKLRSLRSEDPRRKPAREGTRHRQPFRRLDWRSACGRFSFS